MAQPLSYHPLTHVSPTGSRISRNPLPPLPQGTLAQLDSRNPVMYLDFPEGRLKLFGTLAFPRAKFMALRLGTGASVVAEDVFEHLVGTGEQPRGGGLGLNSGDQTNP